MKMTSLSSYKSLLVSVITAILCIASFSLPLRDIELVLGFDLMYLMLAGLFVGTLLCIISLKNVRRALHFAASISGVLIGLSFMAYILLILTMGSLSKV